MAETNTLEILVSVFWLCRDFAVAGTVVFGFLGLFSKRDWGSAAMLWILAALGVLAGFTEAEYETGFLKLDNSLAIVGLLFAAVLIGIGSRTRASLRR